MLFFFGMIDFSDTNRDQITVMNHKILMNNNNLSSFKIMLNYYFFFKVLAKYLLTIIILKTSLFEIWKYTIFNCFRVNPNCL